MMSVIDTRLSGVYLAQPEVHRDERGEFWRSFCSDTLCEHGIGVSVRQSNVSVNDRCFTLRGLHFQRPPAVESKVLTVITGSIYVVIADLRPESHTFLSWEPFEISQGDRTSVIVPVGCATGFLTLEDQTIVHYHMGDVFSPELYGGCRYDDPALGVRWPYVPAVVSDRDLSHAPLDTRVFSDVFEGQ